MLVSAIEWYNSQLSPDDLKRVDDITEEALGTLNQKELYSSALSTLIGLHRCWRKEDQEYDTEE